MTDQVNSPATNAMVGPGPVPCDARRLTGAAAQESSPHGRTYRQRATAPHTSPRLGRHRHRHRDGNGWWRWCTTGGPVATAIELVRTHSQVGHDLIEAISLSLAVARIVLETMIG